MLPDLALISSNYPCLEHVFMVQNMFEPLKFLLYFILNKFYTDAGIKARGLSAGTGGQTITDLLLIKSGEFVIHLHPPRKLNKKT